MKLGKLLKLPQFKNIRLLNHQANLSTNVTTVVTTEAPDIADFVVAGQLVVTTGYPFMNNINGLINLIKIMKDSGAAALVIKEHRYLKKIPTSVIDAANSCFLPILLLPRDIRISTIIQDILQTILKQQNDQLSQIMKDTLNVSRYILAHCSDDEILDHISRLLKCDSLIIDIFGRLKAKNKTAKVDKELLEYTNNQIILINLNQPTVILKKYLLFPLKTTNNLTRRFVIFKLKRVVNSAQRLLIENMVNLLSLESMQVSINVIETRQRRSEIFETILSQELP